MIMLLMMMIMMIGNNNKVNIEFLIIISRDDEKRILGEKYNLRKRTLDGAYVSRSEIANGSEK